ncbi:MAG: DUF2225 domain-containing protein [Nitrospiraceae bacterium]|nr:DUF2225 domain-containing protein [Nitrospiraceae bacterium]
MPGTKSPFVSKSVACPLCRKASRHRFFRQRLFVPEKRESDQHITSYKWLVNDVRRVHPPYYAVIHCPYCLYADMADDFEDGASTAAFPEVVRGIRRGRLDKVVVQLLGDVVNYQEIDFQSALNLHLLAIYFQQLAAEDLQDVYKIGRFYLRVAWLYRERASAAAPEAGAATEEAPPSEVDEAPGVVLGHVQALRNLILDIERRAGELKPLAQARARAADCVDPEAYSGALSDFLGLMALQKKAVARLEVCCEWDVAGLLEGASGAAAPVADTAGASEGYLAVPHEPYMKKLKTLWESVPLNEDEAMVAAIAHFKKALSGDARLGSFQSYVTVANLVADLMVRRGDADGASAMAKSIYQTAAQARQDASAVLHEKDIDEKRRKRAENMVKRATQVIEAATGLREQLNAKRGKDT